MQCSEGNRWRPRAAHVQGASKQDLTLRVHHTIIIYFGILIRSSVIKDWGSMYTLDL